jgi:hypothetical protein
LQPSARNFEWRLDALEESVGDYLYPASDATCGYVTGQILELNGGPSVP